MLLALGSTVSQAEFSLARLKLARTKKNDMLSLKYEVNFVLGSRAGCLANLKPFSIGPTNIDNNAVLLTTIDFGNISGTTINPLICLTDPMKSLYGRVPVKKISLAAHPTKFGGGGAGTHLTILELEMGRVGNSDELDNRTLPFNRFIKVPVYVTTDASGAIQSCHSTQYASKDALGNDITLEEKLCNDTVVGKTANWPEDCLSCLDDGSGYRLCIQCKGLGKKYDPSVKTCV